MGFWAGEMQSVDEMMPYPPYLNYPAGIYEEDKPFYRFSAHQSAFPNLLVVDPIYDCDRNIIMPGYYGLMLSDDRCFLYMIQGDKIIASVPVFKLEEDQRKTAQLRDKKYQKELKKQAKKEAQLNAKLAKTGNPPKEKTVYMDATIEYCAQGKYYLIKYEKECLRAWGAIKIAQ